MTSIRDSTGTGNDLALGPSLASLEIWERKFHDDLVADVAFESSLLPKQLAIVVMIGVLIALREILL